MLISSYPKVLTVGHRYVTAIFNEPVVIEEKVDGSQISFGLFAGRLSVRSKGAAIHGPDEHKMFTKAYKSIEERVHLLHEGWIYRGEYLEKPKHNTIKYSRIPEGHIAIFDIEAGVGNHLNRNHKETAAKGIGYETVPGYVLKIDSLDIIKEFMNKDSFLGGEKVEGYVFKNYGRITPDGKFMAAKYVSERFKERHGIEWRKANPTKGDVTQAIIDALKTAARYEKALQQLKESGVYTGTPSDIGNFLKNIHVDIDEEERDFIVNKLLSHFLPMIKRGVCSSAPQWYKDMLAQQSFNE